MNHATAMTAGAATHTKTVTISDAGQFIAANASGEAILETPIQTIGTAIASNAPKAINAVNG